MIAALPTLILWLIAGGYVLLLLGMILHRINSGTSSRGQGFDEASMRRLRRELARHE